MESYSRTAESVKAGTTANDRRVFAAAAADTGVPSGIAGFSANGRAKGIVTVVPAVGGTCDCKVWKRTSASEAWARDMTVGTAGVVAVAFANGPAQFEVDLLGYDLWAVQLDNFAAGLTANVWLSTVA